MNWWTKLQDKQWNWFKILTNGVIQIIDTQICEKQNAPKFILIKLYKRLSTNIRCALEQNIKQFAYNWVHEWFWKIKQQLNMTNDMQLLQTQDKT